MRGKEVEEVPSKAEAMMAFQRYRRSQSCQTLLEAKELDKPTMAAVE